MVEKASWTAGQLFKNGRKPTPRRGNISAIPAEHGSPLGAKPCWISVETPRITLPQVVHGLWI